VNINSLGYHRLSHLFLSGLSPGFGFHLPMVWGRLGASPHFYASICGNRANKKTYWAAEETFPALFRRDPHIQVELKKGRSGKPDDCWWLSCSYLIPSFVVGPIRRSHSELIAASTLKQRCIILYLQKKEGRLIDSQER